jgi:hypothetical protein
MNREQIEAQLRADNPTTTDDAGGRHGPGSTVYEAAIQRWADAMEAQLAESAAALALASATEALRQIFEALPADKRARLYPLRAGMRLALEAADIEAAAAMVAGFDAADEEEEATRAAMLAALGVS